MFNKVGEGITGIKNRGGALAGLLPVFDDAKLALQGVEKHIKGFFTNSKNSF